MVAGCGGGGSSSDELVRLHFEDTLDFRMDPGDGPEHIVHYDETIAIDRDSSGTRTSAAFEGTRTFQVPKAKEQRLRQALAALDLDLVDQRFGTESDGDGTTTISYDGQTVTTVDKRVRGPGPGGKGELAHRYLAVTRMVEGLSDETVPEVPSSVQRVLHNINRQMTRAAHNRSCEATKNIVARAGLNQRQVQRIYSQVRDQPCP
jgi:hypothetical protein